MLRAPPLGVVCFVKCREVIKGLKRFERFKQHTEHPTPHPNSPFDTSFWISVISSLFTPRAAGAAPQDLQACCFHGAMDVSSIMPLSSCARMWQWTTTSPV